MPFNITVSSSVWCKHWLMIKLSQGLLQNWHQALMAIFHMATAKHRYTKTWVIMIVDHKYLFFRARELGEVLVDQINHPLDRAVWWIEHIMKHPTLYSGRSPLHRLSWFQYFLIDVFAFYALIVGILSWIFYKAVACCCCRKKKIQTSAGSKKNNWVIRIDSVQL